MLFLFSFIFLGVLNTTQNGYNQNLFLTLPRTSVSFLYINESFPFIQVKEKAI